MEMNVIKVGYCQHVPRKNLQSGVRKNCRTFSSHNEYQASLGFGRLWYIWTNCNIVRLACAHILVTHQYRLSRKACAHAATELFIYVIRQSPADARAFRHASSCKFFM